MSIIIIAGIILPGLFYGTRLITDVVFNTLDYIFYSI